MSLVLHGSNGSGDESSLTTVAAAECLAERARDDFFGGLDTSTVSMLGPTLEKI